MTMNFKGKAKRLDDIDLPMVGRLIGVSEDEVHAILDVESAGTGFDKQGRPKMLFEPHIFWRELGPGPKRDQAAKEGLAYPRWKPGAYPKDSYPRLARAMAIDPDAALRSASWGLGQVMGFNHIKAGYDTVLGMVQALIDDEEAHLYAMIRFIQNTGLADELRRHDWKGFALGYNGKGFAKNGYDRKLAESFARWQKIKDTPLPQVNETPISVTRPAPRVNAPALKPVAFNAQALGIATKATKEDILNRRAIAPTPAEAPKPAAQAQSAPQVSAPAKTGPGLFPVILGGLLVWLGAQYHAIADWVGNLFN